MNIIIGTAQFGLDYGISNRSGQVSVDEAKNIIAAGKKRGVNHFDTAPAYGNCEIILREVLCQKATITTKVQPRQDWSSNVSEWLEKSVQHSQVSLGNLKIDELLFHRASDLINCPRNELSMAIKKLKSSGVIEKIGVSIYDFEDIDYITKYYDIDIIQVPYNIFDRRLISENWLSKLKQKNIRVDVRSIFLQGLLLLDPVKRNKYFREWDFLWKKIEDWQKINPKISKLDLCVQFVKQTSNIDNLVIGTQTSSEFHQVMDAYEARKVIEFPSTICCDTRLIDPSKWVLL